MTGRDEVQRKLRHCTCLQGFVDYLDVSHVVWMPDHITYKGSFFAWGPTSIFNEHAWDRGIEPIPDKIFWTLCLIPIVPTAFLILLLAILCGVAFFVAPRCAASCVSFLALQIQHAWLQSDSRKSYLQWLMERAHKFLRCMWCLHALLSLVFLFLARRCGFSNRMTFLNQDLRGTQGEKDSICLFDFSRFVVSYYVVCPSFLGFSIVKALKNSRKIYHLLSSLAVFPRM